MPRDKTKPEKAKDGDAQTAGEGPVAVGGLYADAQEMDCHLHDLKEI